MTHVKYLNSSENLLEFWQSVAQAFLSTLLTCT